MTFVIPDLSADVIPPALPTIIPRNASLTYCHSEERQRRGILYKRFLAAARNDNSGGFEKGDKIQKAAFMVDSG
jgi:hypothetical protein